MSDASKTPPIRPAIIFVRSCGMMVGFITLVVMWGWITHDIVIIKLFPSFAPMQFNTALGLFSCSIALILGDRLRYGRAAISVIPFLIGSLTLIEHISGATLGIDNLFIHSFMDVNVSSLGRMAPNTSMALILTSSALLTYNFAQNKHRAIPFILLVASVVAALGIVPILSSLTGIEAAHAWGSSNRVALHTAFCFTVLGICIIIQLYSRDKNALSWLPLPICVSLLIITGLLSTTIRSEENKNFDSAVQLFL